jgi:glycosyltransferase involved in cell wall biosynthesis
MQERGAPGSSPLHVGILADTIGRPGGIGRYTSELVAALGRRDDVRTIIAAPRAAMDRVHDLAGPNLHATVTIPTESQMGIALWERFRSGRELVKSGAHIVHGTKHLVPRRPSVPTILTVHDLMTITRAHESSMPKRVLLPRQYRASLDQATGLIAASQATRDRLITLDPAWDAKTVVAPNGLSATLVDVAPEPVPKLEGTRFALVVGDLAPRKNIGLLLGIWEQVARETDGFRLVVLGNPGPHSEETTRRLAELDAKGIAIWLRGAGDSALRWCYEHATVVLFPTLEEGFGFPLLEALTFGAPVIASTDPALVEVADGAALVTHLEATDPQAWVRAITQAAAVPRDPPGIPTAPVGAVTWDQNATMVMSLYRALLHLT